MLIKKKSNKNPKNDDYIVALDIGIKYAKALIAKVDGEILEVKLVPGVLNSRWVTCTLVLLPIYQVLCVIAKRL